MKNIVSSLLAIVCLLTMNSLQSFHHIIDNLDHRPSLLFHACCGVCCVYPLLYLDKYFDITIFYTNSNIRPAEEFEHRLSELERYLNLISEKHHISLVVAPYQESFIDTIRPYAKEKEGGKRCYSCYDMRLSDAFEYAKKENYEYCGSVMSISPHKRSDYINEIGLSLQEKYQPVKFLEADFKKENGMLLNNQLNKLVNLYHQNYCGCPFSYRIKSS